MAFPRILFSLLVAAFLFPLSAFAIMKASFSDKFLDPVKETHIFVVGFGKEMGTLFFQNAISTARRLQESFPERQFYFLVQPEKGKKKDKALAKQYRLNVISYDSKPLLGATVVKEIVDFRKISSLEFFSHGHSTYGSALAGNEYNQRFYHGTPGVEELKGGFTKNGYIMIHGCNAGFISAPKLSRLLRVPVGGHLTGSNFQQPFNDGKWYFNDKHLHPVKEVADFSKINTISFEGEKTCSSGHCVRLVADPHGYRGDFGWHKVGLGFRKFYCAYNYGNECYAAIATSLLGFPSLKPITLKSSKADFALVVKDLLCPSDITGEKGGVYGEKRADCFRALDQSLKTANKELSYFRGSEPVCDLDGCKVTAKCKERNCVISADQGRTSKDNLINEYKLYLRGYSQVFGKSAKAELVEPVTHAKLSSATDMSSRIIGVVFSASVKEQKASLDTLKMADADLEEVQSSEGMLGGFSRAAKKVLPHFPRGKSSAN